MLTDMAEAGDVVLSDVHRDVMTTRAVKVTFVLYYQLLIYLCVPQSVTTSKFPFQFPDQTTVYDDDGDMIVYRKEQCLFLIGQYLCLLNYMTLCM